MGRIQTVKTFAIPMLMYRAGSICIDKEVITAANKIIFNFLWKGRDKVKRTSLIDDTEEGGLKPPHLESFIRLKELWSARDLRITNLWMETILLHYLKPVGDKIILCCDFDVKKLPAKSSSVLPRMLECFTQRSAVRVKLSYHPKKYPTPLYGITNSFALMVNQYSIQG